MWWMLAASATLRLLNKNFFHVATFFFKLFFLFCPHPTPASSAGQALSTNKKQFVGDEKKEQFIGLHK